MSGSYESKKDHIMRHGETKLGIEEIIVYHLLKCLLPVSISIYLDAK